MAPKHRTRLTPFGKVIAVLLLAVAALAFVRWQTGAEPQRADVAPRVAPSLSTSPSPAPPLPQCIYGDIPADHTGYDDWNRTVLDTEFRLPSHYRPSDLVPVSRAGFAGDLQVRAVVVDDLAALRRAAANAGHPIDVIAAFRSFQEQADLFESRKEEFGYDRSLDKTARGGHSEHQLGTALDFKSLGAADVTQSWGEEPTGRWMSTNAHRFGFVLSYPRARRNVTCYPYEPWHFRYVGRGRAADVRDSGLTLREYLWRLNHD